MKMNFSSAIIFLAFWVLVISACVKVKPIYYEDDKAVARKKIEQLHQLYNQEDFGAVYELVTDRLKKETSKDAFIAILTNLKKDNGRFLEANEIDSQVIPEASFREVRFKYSSKYEKGWCNEGFAIFVNGKDAVVDLLMINPAEGPAQPRR